MRKSISHNRKMRAVLSRVRLSPTPWTVARQAPLSMEVLQASILEWVAMTSSRGSSQPRDQTCISCVSCIAGRFFTHRATWEAPCSHCTVQTEDSVPRLSPLTTFHNSPPSSTFTSENRDLISEKAKQRRLWIGEHGHMRGQRMRCKGQK